MDAEAVDFYMRLSQLFVILILGTLQIIISAIGLKYQKPSANITIKTKDTAVQTGILFKFVCFTFDLYSLKTNVVVSVKDIAIHAV